MNEEYHKVTHLLELVLALLQVEMALDNRVLSRKLLDLLTIKVVYQTRINSSGKLDIEHQWMFQHQSDKVTWSKK